MQLLPVMDWEEESASIDEFTEVLAAPKARDMARVANARREHFVACLQRINRHMSGLDLAVEKSVEN